MPKLSKETLDFHALKQDFVHDVLRNMSNTGDTLAEVCFGTSGGGIQPNYEIRPTSGQPIAYRGNTHQAVKDLDQWSDTNLTEPFRREEIERGFDLSKKSVEVAKKYIFESLKRDPGKFPHPNPKQAPLLIQAVMAGTPLTKAFEDLRKLQDDDQGRKPPLENEVAHNGGDRLRPISNLELSLGDIPRTDAPYDDVVRFGHTFNGYEQMGSFEACAAVAHSRKHDTLSELRACLFFELRALRHAGDEPEEEDLVYQCGLLEKIRQKVIDNLRD